MTTSQTTHIDDQEGGRPKPRILGHHRLVLPARRWLDLLSSAMKKGRHFDKSTPIISNNYRGFLGHNEQLVWILAYCGELNPNLLSKKKLEQVDCKNNSCIHVS